MVTLVQSSLLCGASVRIGESGVGDGWAAASGGVSSCERAMECAFIPSIKNKSGRMDEFFVGLVSATKRGWVLGWRDAEPYIYIYLASWWVRECLYYRDVFVYRSHGRPYTLKDSREYTLTILKSTIVIQIKGCVGS